MRRHVAHASVLFVCLLMMSTIGTVYAQQTPSCVRAVFRGDASTYNPNFAGWKTGGQALATGGRYNPNAFEAALQLDLARQYRCGYGSRAICHAVVQSPNGRGMIVRINDNGPLVPGRIIDLNEMSMRYISGGTKGRNSGIEKNVTVSLLCGTVGEPGPLNEQDREALKAQIAAAPFVSQPQTFDSQNQVYGGAGTNQGTLDAIKRQNAAAERQAGSFIPQQQSGQGSGVQGSGAVGAGSAAGQPHSTNTQNSTLQNNGAQQYTVPTYSTDTTDGQRDEGQVVTCGRSLGRNFLTWACPLATLPQGLSQPTDSTFRVRQQSEGRVYVTPKRTTQYTVRCLRGQVIVAEQSCRMRVGE